MFYIVDGGPGAGKTLYCVNYLKKHFYHDVYGVLSPKQIEIESLDENGNQILDENKNPVYKKVDFRLVANIDKLKLPHISLKSEIDKAGSVDVYFSKDYQEQLFLSEGPTIFLIDEAQFIFPDTYKIESTFNWIQYHRHYGQTLFFMTQSKFLLPKKMRLCCEFIIRGMGRSKSLLDKHFRYNLLDEADSRLGSEDIVGTEELFSLYRSQISKQTHSTRKPFLKTIVITLVFAALCVSFGSYKLISSMSPHKESDKKQLPSATEIKQINKNDSDNKKSISTNHPQPKFENSSKSKIISDDNSITDESNSIEYDRVKISSFINFRKDKSPEIKLLYKGVYTPDNFPYSLEISRGDYYAYVPKQNKEQPLETRPIVSSVSNSKKQTR